jgi:hypothetical protein
MVDITSQSSVPSQPRRMRLDNETPAVASHFSSHLPPKGMRRETQPRPRRSHFLAGKSLQGHPLMGWWWRNRLGCSAARCSSDDGAHESRPDCFIPLKSEEVKMVLGSALEVAQTRHHRHPSPSVRFRQLCRLRWGILCNFPMRWISAQSIRLNCVRRCA